MNHNISDVSRSDHIGQYDGNIIKSLLFMLYDITDTYLSLKINEIDVLQNATALQ